MVGKDPSEYRPRRALPADDDDQPVSPPPTPAPTPATPAPTPADDHTDDLGAEDDDTAFGIPAYSESDGEDNPKPLYRDEVSERGSADRGSARDTDADTYGRPSNYTGSYGSADPSPYEAAGSAGGAAPQQPAADDADDRTRYQRRVDTGVRPSKDRHLDEDMLDDLGDIDDEPPRLGQRGRLALLIGAVAAVVVLGLAIGYAVIGRPNGPSANPGPGPSPASSESSTTGTPGQADGELLTTEMLVAAPDAKPIDGDRTWKVSRTLTKIDRTSPQPICLGVAIDGLPTARETMMQLLESDGKQPPAILHQATAYGTPEEAAQAYALIAKAVGTCSAEGTGAWLYSGRVVTGLGDQSLGVVVKVTNGKDQEFRSLILSRTGRVLNVVDVAKQKEGVPIEDTVRTVAAAVNRQCTAAEGSCAKKTADKAGPPPVGDQPGYLSGGDLPAPSSSAGAWFADDPQNLTEPQHGTSCETADLSKVAGGRAVARTFLVDGDAGNFGLDQYMVTLKSESEAKKLATKFRDDWKNCRERKVTPTVEDPAKIKGTGAKDAGISGWVTEVKVPTENETRTYRVGVAWVGPKLVYTFLSPTDKLDISESDWKRVTVRAAERATQVN
ncbi:hypothetical protein [Microlunatus speluncae]|uniref:hypothetical protein n=1 Tax=Microlunatus speluncae TaxID=2594267 RepID=UPI0012662AF2|nr:hypothetical protein [Microlunatus speluncae]